MTSAEYPPNNTKVVATVFMTKDQHMKYYIPDQEKEWDVYYRGDRVKTGQLMITFLVLDVVNEIKKFPPAADGSYPKSFVMCILTQAFWCIEWLSKKAEEIGRAHV